MEMMLCYLTKPSVPVGGMWDDKKEITGETGWCYGLVGGKVSREQCRRL